ncbi:hypothetical protein CcCBS67573_g08740 [Chytriomyces confervae]|uniref:Uncharacterized protein n=1 Tax=Chytriomyces confervae TaxID=246404 RepID=A0A507EIR1_9FUNG|nr:hypothetical protein CcCBS67573_g08740 [Chytriomyces confervae]
MDDDQANAYLQPHGVSRHCALTNHELGQLFGSQKRKDRRAWSKPELQQCLTSFCSTCIVSGIPHSALHVSIDRIWDNEGLYKTGDVSAMGVLVNYGKHAIPAFRSKEHLRAHQVSTGISLDIHPLKVLVILVRPYLERFIDFQRAARVG